MASVRRGGVPHLAREKVRASQLEFMIRDSDDWLLWN